MKLVLRLAKLAAALSLAAVAAGASAVTGRIAWIADDWPRALAEARKRDALVVVDAWAPW
jgi:hypothetical protein